ncbi:WhiB family transcriptional regulator [Rhodococcus sp. Z13]|uniref:WhiB family transcriptional regulator n=1 Tax=Rhodococcus sacchari TaxID=2962047 RepID=A0ACD4DKH5_9NOCA|nr:WhiB family transcriptional regulator [Rhodococcus sp. Z13]UYP20455.1 WhiB family transcriptional regulator [Rhodococcus sp. Z13]
MSPTALLDAFRDRQAQPLCRSRDVDFFDDAPEAIARAKAVCASCPVREPCRDQAALAGEMHGVWGGLTPTELVRHRWLARARSAGHDRARHSRIPRGHST